MLDHKPSIQEKKIYLSKFNEMFNEAINKKKEILMKLRQLIHEAEEVDNIAGKAYWYGNDYLYFRNSDDMIECINKRTRKRMSKLDDLRKFSYDI